ncbi:MAG TPA: hemerythrin domain-containing protein [Polyangiales bacterium]|nr:hemerythrin domain-containing protein [Polyangiales bacterium]
MDTEMSVRESLGSDHEAINRALSDLANAVEGADFPTILEVFRDVDRGLRAHMYGEERYLFRDFEESHPADVRELREDHDRFHRKLDELMIETELHTLRKESIDALIEELRAHASKENVTLYEWADQPLHEAQRDALFAFLEKRRAALRDRG